MVKTSAYEAYQIDSISHEYRGIGYQTYTEISLSDVLNILGERLELDDEVLNRTANFRRDFRFDIFAMRLEKFSLGADEMPYERASFVIVEVINRATDEYSLNEKRAVFDWLAILAPDIKVDFRYIEKDEQPLFASIQERTPLLIQDVVNKRLSKYDDDVVSSPKQILEYWGMCATTIRSFCEYLNVANTDSLPPLELYNELLAKKKLVPAEDIYPEMVTLTLFDAYEGVKAALLGVVLNEIVSLQMRFHLESIRTQVRKYLRAKN